MKIFQNLKHLVIDCERIKKSIVHFNLDEALYVHSCLKPKKTILTNLNSDLNYDSLLKRLPKNVLPAYDGLACLLYTSPSPRDATLSRMPSSA